jgi:hypothetical protein
MLTETTSFGTRAWPLSLPHRISRLAERQGLLILVLVGYAGALVFTASGTAPDTWLGIVGGREIAHHGLPSVDQLTVLAQGERWVDQQWLAQLTFYGAYATGGLLLVALASAAFAFAAIAGAAAHARWRGADMRTTVWVAAAAMVPYLLPAEVPRAQTLSYPLFVGVVWLLIRDNLRPAPSVLFVLPLLALWSNVHGSVLVGVFLVVLHGLWVIRRRAVVGAGLVVGGMLSLFASPYATGLPHYYASTIFNPAFKLLNEWGPTTLGLGTAPLFLLLFVAAYLFGRVGRQFTATEKIILIVTAVAALHAIRFTVWFALAALMILPRPLTTLVRPQLPPADLNRLCGKLGIAAVVGLVGILFVRGVPGFPSAAAASVTAASGDRSAVYASELYGDWLLTVAPSLRGRVAYDSRIELLPAHVVGQVQLAQAAGIGWQDLSRRYRVFVLNASEQSRLVANLSHAGYAPRYRHGSLVVLARARPRGFAR